MAAMTEVALPQNTWVEIATGVSQFVFNLSNFPQNGGLVWYKVNYGTSLPPVDTTNFIAITMEAAITKTVTFSNSSAENIYVMAVNRDGAAIL